MTDRTSRAQTSSLQEDLGELAPDLVRYTEQLLFADVWARPQLGARDRSLVTIAALVAGGNSEQLNFHLQLAMANGVTQAEVVEAITHLAFYTGWPRAMSAINVAKQVCFEDD